MAPQACQGRAEHACAALDAPGVRGMLSCAFFITDEEGRPRQGRIGRRLMSSWSQQGQVFHVKQAPLAVRLARDQRGAFLCPSPIS